MWYYTPRVVAGCRASSLSERPVTPEVAGSSLALIPEPSLGL
jgi:hypothetical protein